MFLKCLENRRNPDPPGLMPQLVQFLNAASSPTGKRQNCKAWEPLSVNTLPFKQRESRGKCWGAWWEDQMFYNRYPLLFDSCSEFSVVLMINFSTLFHWGSLSSEQNSVTLWSTELPNDRTWVIVTPSHLFKALISKHVLYVLIVWSMFLCLYVQRIFSWYGKCLVTFRFLYNKGS